MGSQQVKLSGTIVVGASVCDPCAAPSSKLQGLSLSCETSWFQAVVSTDLPHAIETAGALGAAFVDVPATPALDRVELLYVRTNTLMRLRIGADVAQLVSTGPTLPLSGGETLILAVDGQAAVTTTFSAAATALQVAKEINAAAALLGQAPPASINASGQLVLSGLLTGSDGSVSVTGGTGKAALGFASGSNDSAVGAGSDVDVRGAFLAELGRSTDAPARVMISGSGTVEVFAAGTPAA